MRKRARERDGVEEGEEEGEGGGWRERGRKEKKGECSVTDTTGHINFFTDLQKGVRALYHICIYVHHSFTCWNPHITTIPI